MESIDLVINRQILGVLTTLYHSTPVDSSSLAIIVLLLMCICVKLQNTSRQLIIAIA